jgi:hypothetical protein
MGKRNKSKRNSFSKAFKNKFIIDFNKQQLSLADYLRFLNDNALNTHLILYDSANRWLIQNNIPNRSTKSKSLTQLQRFQVVKQFMDTTTSSGTYSTMVTFCAEHSYNYDTMKRWKSEYLACV